MKHLKAEIEKAIVDKHITVQKHPSADIFIYNYSPICQYDKIWNEVTRNCRGLILDAEYNVVARSFKKFFNYEEIKSQIPNEPFIVMDKMDGSLGILYWVDGKPYISTRGSFNSDQAIKATELLHTKYRHTWDKLMEVSEKGITPLFEIIYAENRIVVDYGEKEELILLGAIGNDDSQYRDIWNMDLGFPVVKKYDGISDFTKLKELNEENKEGFVVRFDGGFMMKIKFDDYVRLHKILTQTSSKVIWEFLKDKKPMNEILENIPDEFYQWVKDTKESLENEFLKIEKDSKILFSSIMNELSNVYGFPVDSHGFKLSYRKKDFALKVMGDHASKRVSGILFSIVDGKSYEDIIWKMIKPEYERPFKKNTDI